MTIEIDWEIVDGLLEAGNDGVRVAANLGMSPETLYRKCKNEKNISFESYAAQKRARGDSLLAAKQYTIAMKGNVSMLIWLGKNRLGQKDKQDIEVLTELASGLNDLLATVAKNNSEKSSNSQSTMAPREPLLDKGHSGQSDQIQA